MKFEWDESKRRANLRDRQLDFADAIEMFSSPMLTQVDNRKRYGEIRQIGLGQVQGRLMVIVFTELRSNTIRVISYRKANKREQAKFKATIANQLEKS
jgi:hypothetical protein